jgi:preprotein translocase subunit SecG
VEIDLELCDAGRLMPPHADYEWNAMSQVWAYLSVLALMLTGLLLIFIILLQRGRGGGLAGAFGGAGGQSALGTKAGDVFTKITVGLAVFWVFLACLSIYALRAGTEGRMRFADAETTDTAAVGPATDPPTAPPDVTGAGRPQGATGAATTRPGVESQLPLTGTGLPGTGPSLVDPPGRTEIPADDASQAP